VGHDSEHAAIIYQHEARGADLLITNAIDAQIEAGNASQAWTATACRKRNSSPGDDPLTAADGPWRSTKREQGRESCPAYPRPRQH
jgi:hypothetical protein